MKTFTMPSLGSDMEGGRFIEWLVGSGDRVSRGQAAAVVETQKGAIEIEFLEAGEIGELIARPGEVLAVGAPLARFRPDAAEVAPSDGFAQPPSGEILQTAHGDTATGGPVRTPDAAGRSPAKAVGALAASPAARTRARGLGIALDAVRGSGPGGAVLLGDVERHAAAEGPPTVEPIAQDRPQGKPGLDLAEMRRAIAGAMSRAKREIPHYYLTHEIDLQSAHERLLALNAGRTPDRRLLLGAILVHATIRAVAKVPELNGRFEAEPYAPSPGVHCGLAIALRGGGLIAPAILDAHAMDPDAIMDAMRDLVARARSGRLRNREMTQGTITVSSLGEAGVDALIGVIYPPQVALVGFGAPRQKPMVRDGAVQPRLAVTASLSADHRVSDGRRGALFLAEIARLLQEPDIP